MPQIIGEKIKVVDTGSFHIMEYAGNVATNNDTLSIAHVTVDHAPTKEPWLTIQYDEWICVLQGRIELHYYNNNNNNNNDNNNNNVVDTTDKNDTKNQNISILSVRAGETVLVSKGERFRPVFPEVGTVYVPVCLPAFRPDRCAREEEEVGAETVSNTTTTNDDKKEGQEEKEEEIPTIVYHMCEKKRWENCCKEKRAYFPPTFVEDGYFTHATAITQRLIETANHFYKSSLDDWICLQIDTKQLLQQLGIRTIFEGAKSVGTIQTKKNNDWQTWRCPHIYGGIPTTIDGIIINTYDMKRNKDDGSFLEIVGIDSSSSFEKKETYYSTN